MVAQNKGYGNFQGDAFDNCFIIQLYDKTNAQAKAAHQRIRLPFYSSYDRIAFFCFMFGSLQNFFTVV